MVAPLLDYMPGAARALIVDLPASSSRWAASRARRTAAGGSYGQAPSDAAHLKSALAPFLAGIPIRTGFVGEARFGLSMTCVPASAPPAHGRPLCDACTTERRNGSGRMAFAALSDVGGPRSQLAGAPWARAGWSLRRRLWAGAVGPSKRWPYTPIWRARLVAEGTACGSRRAGRAELAAEIVRGANAEYTRSQRGPICARPSWRSPPPTPRFERGVRTQLTHIISYGLKIEIMIKTIT